MFGGYGGVRDGQGYYLDDLWKFDLESYKWEQLTTTGEVPESRSNYTLHLYAPKNEVVMFGGGTDNRARFNFIFILNLDSLQWRQLVPN
jgi:N-acetylneuraminic acid mutarotase